MIKHPFSSTPLTGQRIFSTHPNNYTLQVFIFWLTFQGSRTVDISCLNCQIHLEKLRAPQPKTAGVFWGERGGSFDVDLVVTKIGSYSTMAAAAWMQHFLIKKKAQMLLFFFFFYFSLALKRVWWALCCIKAQHGAVMRIKCQVTVTPSKPVGSKAKPSFPPKHQFSAHWKCSLLEAGMMHEQDFRLRSWRAHFINPLFRLIFMMIMLNV